MKQSEKCPTHPGSYIKKYVIPSGMSVTEAAKQLNVGRPALSNLLNANSSLSPEMAIRMEKTFGADRQKLLDLQSEFDRYGCYDIEKSIAARTYVPAFLKITAKQIHQWPNNNLEARQLLPVLMRRLVHSTGLGLSEVDFPGYDNAERKGSDGKTIAGATTPWIPEGRCYWEFGVDQDPKNKAEHDYQTRIGSISSSERQECTFIFVTPRNWHGKTAWVESKQTTGDWKSVRAYDASDLEQWLETSIPAQAWFAKILNPSTDGFETLDQFWEHWSSATEPKLTSAIFAPSVEVWCDRFKKWLEKESDRPFVVTADSKDEALAFLACMFRDSSIDPQYGDLATIFKSADTLRELASSPAPFIPIVFVAETERELATMYQERHCIVVHPRNAVESKPNIILDRLDHNRFLDALTDLNIGRDRAERLARESGRSPTILRRRLSENNATRIPLWAQKESIANSLIPMVLIGVWHTKSDADRQIVSFLGNRPYGEIEKDLAKILVRDESPIWSRGQYCGVISRIDVLFAVSRLVTERELKDFFWLAEYVLSEADPALDLPEHDRWAAPMYGKIRDHSAELRNSICEMLVILSVHGDHLFSGRLGVSVEDRVSSLINSLLTSLTLDKLLSYDRDLPWFAEAAPQAFLEIIKRDLQESQPVVFGLLKPTAPSPLSPCLRSGLLWALECLAWQNLMDVCLILARLSMTAIDDNWINKPINSLEAIFRSWVPQTAASLEERMWALERITQDFPDIGWKICINQLGTGDDLGFYSFRPRWRSDAFGTGRPLKAREQISQFRSKAFELILNWQHHDENTLHDLVERIHILHQSEQEKVWRLVNVWADSEADDDAKAKIVEKIHRFVLTRRGTKLGLNTETKERAQAVCEKLQVSDPVLRHAWLYANEWIKLSADDMGDDDINAAYSRHEAKIDRLRREAMYEIWEVHGFTGIKKLLLEGGVARLVGTYLARSLEGKQTRTDILRECLLVTDEIERHMDSFMQGFLAEIKKEERDSIIADVVADANNEVSVRVFRCAPCGEDTWCLLDQYGEEATNRYWQTVLPYSRGHSENELMEMIDQLLKVNRPRAAFSAVQYDWPRIETSRLKRLLLEIVTIDEDPSEHFRIEPYDISKALNSLEQRNQTSEEEMAWLEFLYIKVLDHREHRISNLERQIARSPGLFVRLLALVCKRDDGGQDPTDWSVKDSGRRWYTERAYRVFGQIKLIPGTGDDGTIDSETLHEWIVETRRLCSEHGRSAIGDEYIGQLLSRSEPQQEGDIWPCTPICKAMERGASSEIGLGFEIGVRNARGAHFRERGGKQERELAAVYRSRANQLGFEFPYVRRVIEDIAAAYDREAKWHDDRAEVKDRLSQ